MAISFVGGASAYWVTADPVTVDLTSLTGGSNSSPSAGDVILLIVGMRATSGAFTGSVEENYYFLGSKYGVQSSVAIYGKVSDGTESSVSVNGLGSLGAYAGSVAVYVWRGCSGVGEPVFASSSSSGYPDPPAVTTPYDDCEVIVFSSAGVNDTLTAPSGYGNAISITGGGSYANATSVASRTVSTAGSEDPAAWTGSTTPANWSSGTIVLRASSAQKGEVASSSAWVAEKYHNGVEASSAWVAEKYLNGVEASSAWVVEKYLNSVEAASVWVAFTPSEGGGGAKTGIINT